MTYKDIKEKYYKLAKELGFVYRERRRFIGKGKTEPDGEGKKWIHKCHGCEIDITKLWNFILKQVIPMVEKKQREKVMEESYDLSGECKTASEHHEKLMIFLGKLCKIK